MSDEVLAVGGWATNAAMIADVARLGPDGDGYLAGEVLDATYGQGRFWRLYRPELLVTNDLHVPGTDLGFDYTRFPMPDGWCDSVVLDPPYRLSGRRDQGRKDSDYGTTVRRSRADVLDEIVAATVECYRVARRYLLVKCQDQVEGGRVRWQTDLVTGAVEAVGGRKVDRFDLVTVLRPQPPGRRQLTARRNVSTLLVFERRSAR